jgi:serpin B
MPDATQPASTNTSTKNEADMNTLRPEFTDANTRFGLDLFKQVVQQDAGKNAFISPVNVSIALAITTNGAKGDTQQAMLQALETADATLDQMNTDYAALQALLQREEVSVTLSIANSLWLAQGAPLNADFQQRVQQAFNTQVTELDFDDPGASGTINAWASDATNGKIPQVIGEIQPGTVLLIVSAIYFQGAWERPFTVESTQDLPFTLADGSQKQVATMYQSGRFSYLKGGNFQAVQLPYVGDAMYMTVMLPDEGTTASQLAEGLTSETWRELPMQFTSKEGKLFLPRFKLEYGVSLSDSLKQLGMDIAFDANRADFSGMRPIPPNVFISNVRHASFVEVNESGTEAAAATVVEMGVTSMQPADESFTMTVDRPFVVAIVDRQTNSPIFLGIVAAP